MAPGLFSCYETIGMRIIAVNRILSIRFDVLSTRRNVWRFESDGHVNFFVREVIHATAGVSDRYGGYWQRINVGHW